MSVLLYIAIAIAAIVLGVVALFYLAKGIITLLCWFLRLIPTLIKAAIYWSLILLLCFVFEITNMLSEFPLVYPLLYLVIVALILARKFVKQGSVFGASGGEYKGYVLNKKSKVIHEKYSGSDDSIGSHHRKELSYSEARELVDNGGKYRFKKDN